MIDNEVLSSIIRQEVPIKCFSIAAYICKIEDNNGKYLIIKRCDKYLKDSWQMVSGKIELNEKAWEAALREITEETGIIPDRLYSVNKLETFYEINQNCINLVPIFIAFIDKDQKIKLSDNEHNEYKWITIDEANDYLIFTHQIDTIRYIEKEFIKKKPNKFLEIKINNVNGA